MKTFINSNHSYLNYKSVRLLRSFRSLAMTILLLMTGILVAGLVYAAELTPPKLPVLYYGAVTINGELATTSPIITMRRKTDGQEIAGTTAAANGRYFIEAPCSDYPDQAMIFRIGNLIAAEANCVDANAVPSVNLNLNFNSANQIAENTTANINIPASVADDVTVEIHFTATSTSGGLTTLILPNGLILKRESAAAANNFLVSFAPGTVISGGISWDGTLIAPTLSNISLSIPADPSYRSQAEKIISLGYAGESLTFDQPVSIIFPGQTGKQIGFSLNGADFTEITAICAENSGSGLASTTQECKFNGATDLTVWTKHFTYYAVYKQVYVPPPSRGGASISIAEIKPVAVATTTVATTTAPSVTRTPAVEEETEPKAEPQVSPQILGVKYYANGTLIRGKDKKIYLISGDKLVVIRTLPQLQKYKEQKIYDVPDEVIRQYMSFFNGDLIRGPDKKIYRLNEGNIILIKSLNELRPYAGRPIHNVSGEILSKYKITPQILGVKYYGEGTLIRGKDGKIYLIKNDKLIVIRNYIQLLPFKGQIIYDVTDSAIRQYMNFFDGDLIRGPDQKIYMIQNNKKQPIISLAELRPYAGRPIHNVSDKILGLY